MNSASSPGLPLILKRAAQPSHLLTASFQADARWGDTAGDDRWKGHRALNGVERDGGAGRCNGEGGGRRRSRVSPSALCTLLMSDGTVHVKCMRAVELLIVLFISLSYRRDVSLKNHELSWFRCGLHQTLAQLLRALSVLKHGNPVAPVVPELSARVLLPTVNSNSMETERFPSCPGPKTTDFSEFEHCWKRLGYEVRHNK